MASRLLSSTIVNDLQTDRERERERERETRNDGFVDRTADTVAWQAAAADEHISSRRRQRDDGRGDRGLPTPQNSPFNLGGGGVGGTQSIIAQSITFRVVSIYWQGVAPFP